MKHKANFYKKIHIVSFFVFCSFALFGQSPVDNSSQNSVNHVLTKFPAQNKEQLGQLQEELFSAGEEGINRLIHYLELADQQRVQAEYALNSMTNYVSEKRNTTHRTWLINAYLKSLDRLKSTEAKVFVIRELGLIGSDDVVAGLSSCLSDNSLVEPASMALAAIQTPASCDALLKALTIVENNRSKELLVQAIGETQFAKGESFLLEMLRSGDPALHTAVQTALGSCGSEVALPDLALAAQKEGYLMEKSGATAAYLSLIRRVLSQGNKEKAIESASKSLKKAGQSGQYQLRNAALQILFDANPSNSFQTLQKALSDKDRKYRMAAINYALDHADASLCEKLAVRLKKVSPELKIDIMHGLLSRYEELAGKGLFNNGFYTDIFIQQLSNKNIDVKQAAAGLLMKTGSTAAITALVRLLNDKDAQVVTMAKDCLSATKRDVQSVMATHISTASEQGKIAMIQLLSERKADKYGSVVFAELKSPSSRVQKEAYSALKNITTVNELTALYIILEESKPEYVSEVQQAIIAALKPMSKDKRYETISNRIGQVDKNKQVLYYGILPGTGSDEALNFIVDRFRKGDQSERDFAFDALLNWKGVKAASHLLAICNDPASEVYFDRAFDAYVGIASDTRLRAENRRIHLTNALEVARTDQQKVEIIKQLGQTNSFLGMLLAGRFLDNEATQQAAANTIMNIALNNKHLTGKNVRALLQKTSEVLNNPDAEYQRKAIQKHLDEMPTEEGFVSIFNGKDLSGWRGLVGNPITRAKMDPETLAQKQVLADKKAHEHWIPQDGILVFDGKKGGDNLCTTELYGDFEMYVDWKLEPSTEADAGIYLRGTPQVQIWNTARVNVGAQVGSGGLYNNKVHPRNPLQVADNPLGEWNTFYIKMQGDRVSVVFNGVTVVDNVILENYWDRSQPIFPIEQIELQAHGSKVYYRNIYVKKM